MARSRSASERVALAAVVLAILAGGCRLFVDLDGLSDQATAAPDASLPVDGGHASDATSLDDAALDGPPVENPDVGAPPQDGGCAGKGGPAAIRVDSGAISYCIDTTEVTRVQYDAFLQSAPVTGAQPSVCAWNTSFLPTIDWPYTLQTKDFPVVGVDWCDAYAFCAWSGKRLCGSIGAATVADIADPGKNEWLHACSRGGTRTYPYGNIYDPQACNGGDHIAQAILPAGALKSCEGGFPGLFDLSGNLHEWIGFCAAAPPDAGEGDAPCAISDSSYLHGQADMACSSFTGISRSISEGEIGFRCCSP